MENNFICPKCEGFLNISERIAFSVKSKQGKRGLIFLSPKVGDYAVESNPEFEYEPGDQLSFYCPLCQEDLTAHEINKNLAEIVMVEKDNVKHKILFSMVVGERCTYKVSEDKYESFGESSGKYINFINLSMR